jgi:hypothetical protein
METRNKGSQKMTTYTVIWKNADSNDLFTDEVMVDSRLDEEIKEFQNYEPLMMPIMIESAQDYLGFEEEGEEVITATDMVESLMQNARIVSVFCHEDNKLIDYADSLDRLINVLIEEQEVETKKPELHLVN